jgi:lipid-A-disaccharide synthase
MSQPAPSQPEDKEPSKQGLLFTAFEPSGDDHASVVIAELRRRNPDVPIYAWGGRGMEAAGAIVVERTGEDAVMGVPGLAKIIEHRRINKRIGRWMAENPIALHIPVDSPAANFPICALAKRHGIKVMHLVAPQLWAWGPWRIRKLRRLTSCVLCLLPFEEEWFLSRGVKARFIGHPLFDEPLDEAALDERAREVGLDGEPKIAIMPGSRPGELASFPILLDMFRRLRHDFPDTVGLVAATRPEVADRLREVAGAHGGWPEGLDIASGETDAVIRWCDYAVVVSGTVTLQVARQRKPMITFYRPNRLMYHLLARWLVSTRFYTLPNLIANKKIVPELIPHFGDGEELALQVIRLMRRPGYAEDQSEELGKVVERFSGLQAGVAAADAIEESLGSAGGPPMTTLPTFPPPG